MRATRCVAVAFALLLAVLPTPSAFSATRLDADDVRGRLDLKQVLFTSWDGPFSPPRLRFQATMYNRWTCRQAHQLLEDACLVSFYLDTKGVSRSARHGLDYRIIWHARFCSVLERDRPTETLIARGIADKDRRSAFCSVRRSKLDVRKKIRWFVVTTWANQDHGWYATDFAPSVGWYD